MAPLVLVDVCKCAACRTLGNDAGVSRLKAMAEYKPWRNRAHGSSARLGGCCCGIFGRFDLLELGLTSFHREDSTWSGGNVVRASFFAFFAKGHIKA
ncbi:hypothetical protein Taro_038002 [Colocasia esculenta]|uniref:Uncharacterized protein n=1 Tax=Colocasia esculenta TaxID=4460 RepID=A0A843W5J2_COLES|nr:hypothetical protein [Colocasia esculenta]